MNGSAIVISETSNEIQDDNAVKCVERILETRR